MKRKTGKNDYNEAIHQETNQSSPENYLTLSPMETISRKRRLNVLTTLYQNACLLLLSLPGSFANKNAIKHKIKVSVLLCRPRL